MIGEDGCFGERGARGDGERQRRGDGVARARHIRHFARDRRYRALDRRVRQPHSLFASRDEHRLRSRRRSECLRGPARIVVGPDADVRRDFSLVMVRRDEGRAGVEGEMRDFGIDEQRGSLA